MVLEQPPTQKASPVPPAGPAAPVAPAARRKPWPSPTLARRAGIGLLLLLTFVLASFAIRNTDFWVHLATGRLIAGGQYQFGVDPFSFTTEAVYWTNSSWLYDLFIYGLHQAAGGAGLVVAKAILLTVLAWLLLQFRRPGQTMVLPIIATTLAVVTMSPRFLYQPMCVSLLFLGLTLYLLERSKQAERSLWLLPPLFLLWANLDSWFILGLIAALLYFIGSLVEGMTKPRRRSLGFALLLSVGCCLINPHLLRVFTLPPELAYLSVQATDWLQQATGIDIGPPEWMVSAGRTWQVLRNNDLDFTLWLSPVSERHRHVAALGNNLAGKSYFLLFVLGLLSFSLPTRTGWRRRDWSLLAVWLPLALLSLALARMIGFFAVVTGPVIALNFGDYLQARAARAGKPIPHLLPLVGIVTGVLLVGLLLLAWPGWVNGPVNNFAWPRRVAWSIEPDASLRQTAERLGALHQAGKVRGGVPLSIELANFLPWYAPGVKSFCDVRFELFSGIVDDFYRIRRVLSRDADEFFAGKAPPLELQFAEWRKLAERHDLDFLALTNFPGAPVTQQLAMRFWLEPGLWPFLYQDGRSLIFGWNQPGQPDRFAGERVNWNAAAFGTVPDSHRPPSEGSVVPPPETFLESYLLGRQSTPLEVPEIALEQSANQLFSQFWAQFYFRGLQVASLAPMAGMAAAAPGTVTVNTAMMPLVPVLATKVLGPMLRPVDRGPPALPVLMVRAGRRAVAKAPSNPDCYLALADTYNVLWQGQENHWALDRGQDRAANFLNTRNMLRRVQRTAALKACLQLDPDNSLVHEVMAEMFNELYFLDVAFEHLAAALASFDRRRPAPGDPKLEAAFREKKERLQAAVERYKKALQRRRNDFDLRAMSKSSLEKYDIALRRPFKSIELGKDHVDRRGMGLALTALSALRETKLARPEEFITIVRYQLELLLLLGEVQIVGDALQTAEMKKVLGPAFSHYEALWAAAIGNYDLARTALTTQIDQLELRKQVDSVRSFLVMHMAPGMTVGDLTSQAHWFVSYQSVLPLTLSSVANLRLLRGLMALEQGDNHAALRDFQACLDLTTNVYFPDRPIADRYRTLIPQQHR